jgi:hypothetical protein
MDDRLLSSAAVWGNAMTALDLRRWARVALALGFLACAPRVAPAAEAAGRPYDEIVRTQIQPKTERLLAQLAAHGRSLAVDGVPVFNGSDKFLPGKIALGLTDFLATLPKDDPRLPQYLRDFRGIAVLTVDDANDTWGIYYYLSALDQLRRAGMLETAVDPSTLAKLRVRLDWRSFVEPDTLHLIDLPNNYYNVAFSIARLRQRMGWEGPEGGEKLFAKIADHYRAYSGPYGFADETDGEGRFDRYSVLLAGEVAHHFLETGGEPPPEARAWLRKSLEVMLPRLNGRGEGFEYGRSLGPYSETAIIEVLTAAAALHMLTPREEALAYAYASRAAQRYVDFWIDRRTGSLNLWDDGRRTDAYRGKFRILGENLSLAHQFIYTSAIWDALGYHGRAPEPGLAQAADAAPKRTVTWFARGKYDRLLLTLRDRGHVIGLPLINGGASQHMNSPYYPIPYANGMVSAVADEAIPQLLPRFTMADGTVLAPLAYFRDVAVTTKGAATIVTYRQSEVDRLGAPDARPDDRISVATTYVLAPGRITRTDVVTPKGQVALRGFDMEFAAYGQAPVAAKSGFRYGGGAVTGFTAEGFDHCAARPTDGDKTYRTPTGAFGSVVGCASGPRLLTGPLKLSWTLTYD